MIDEKNTVDSELNLTTDDNESQAVDADTTSEQVEQVESSIDLEKEEVNTTEQSTANATAKAEIEAQKQEDAWYANILSGKKSLDDLKTMPWLFTRVQSRLNAVQKTPDIERIVEQKLKEKEEDMKFNNLQSQLPKMSNEQASKLKELYSKYRPLGKFTALETAVNLLGLSTKIQEAEKRGIAKARMSLPSNSGTVKKAESSELERWIRGESIGQ